MNLGIFDKKEKTYETVRATREDLIFELIVAEGKDLIVLEESHIKIAKNRKGEIVSIFELSKPFNHEVLFGMARV